MRVNSEPVVDTRTARRLSTAGWLTFAAVLLWVCSDIWMIIGLMADMPGRVYDPLQISLILAHGGCWVFALLQFRRLLNERFDFHDVDTLITLNIVALVLFHGYTIFLTITMTVAEMGNWSDDAAFMALIPSLIPLLLITFLSGVVGLFFGVRLLSLKDPLFGLKAPMGYTYIVGSILTITVILAPLGVIFLLVAEVFQGIILLRSARQVPPVHFV